ncbi:MAG TPA: hypothetical protein VNM14_19405 [Planctomycetota bacterium]|nr:hypothetical protein [Planctomycetota bacterium]
MTLSLAVLVLAFGVQDPKFSGPQKGEKAPGFKVFDVGTRQELDVLADGKGAPTLLVFIHDLSRPGAALLRALDEHGQIKQARGLRTQFVSLSEDRDGAERHLPVVVKALNLRSPLGISLDGKEGPGAYGLNREVMLTILVVREQKVAANFAIVSPNETDAPRIKTELDEVLKAVAPPPAGTPEELREQVARLQEEVATLREEIAALRLKIEQPRPPGPRRGEMERPKEDEQLVNLCRRLIQPRATQDQIDVAVKDIEAYVGSNDDLKKQYAGILGRVLDLKYGNEMGQAAMRKQLEKYGK